MLPIVGVKIKIEVLDSFSSNFVPDINKRGNKCLKCHDVDERAPSACHIRDHTPSDTFIYFFFVQYQLK